MDAEAWISGLDDDSYLDGAKTVAGALLALALTAMLITSLVGAPIVAWTVLLVVVAAGLIVVTRMPSVRRRGDRRAPTDP
jgi:xanthine/uracil/vitamin C permease (AzgA family)